MKYVSLDQINDQRVSHNAAIRKKVMLTSGELPSLTQLAQAYFAPGQIANAHQHSDMHEVFFVQSGNGQIVIDGKVYGLSPGVCVAVSPGETHEVSNTSSEPLILTYFGIQAES